jgi:hypothetical protein
VGPSEIEDQIARFVGSAITILAYRYEPYRAGRLVSIGVFATAFSIVKGNVLPPLYLPPDARGWAGENLPRSTAGNVI